MRIKEKPIYTNHLIISQLITSEKIGKSFFCDC